MSKYTKYANQLNMFAEYFDSVGNHDSANECVDLLHKLAEYQQKEIRLASTRDSFQQAHEAYRGGKKDTAESLITKAVLESLK